MRSLVILGLLSYGLGGAIEDYMKERSAILKENEDYSMAAKTLLTPQEELVDKWLTAARADITGFPPREYFNSRNVRHRIEDNELFAFLKEMPKGSALHMHESASGDIDWLLNTGIHFPQCFVYFGDAKVNGSFSCFPGDAPSGYYRAREVDVDFRDLLTIENLSPVGMDSGDFWSEFGKRFARSFGLMRYMPFYQEYMHNLLESVYADGVRHLELRHNPMTDNYDDSGILPPIDAMRMVKQACDDFTTSHPDFTVQLIIYGNRHVSKSILLSDLETTFRLKSAFPDFILGFDLVGQEDTPAGFSTIHYLEILLVELKRLEGDYNIKMPLFLHDGESDRPNDVNVIDAILLDSKRIGHGTNTFHFPAAERLIKEREIAIEVCPISNQILGYVQDMRLHPASGYLRRGLPVVISSDDSMLFGYTGLAYDYWEAVVAWDLDLKSLKTLVENTIKYSALDVTSMEKLHSDWSTCWDSFISRMSVKLSSASF